MDAFTFGFSSKVEQYVEQGREAFRSHTSRVDNPHPASSLAGVAWLNGWHQQRYVTLEV